jgi:hypothetical protein
MGDRALRIALPQIWFETAYLGREARVGSGCWVQSGLTCGRGVVSWLLGRAESAYASEGGEEHLAPPRRRR